MADRREEGVRVGGKRGEGGMEGSGEKRTVREEVGDGRGET